MMAKKNKQILDFRIDIDDKDLHELFDPLDPLHTIDKGSFENLKEVRASHDPIDYPYLHSLADDIFGPIIDHYFRAEIIGGDKIPQKGPLILASNHSGNAFPHDAIALDGLLWRRSQFRNDRKFRSVYSQSLTAKWWMRPFGIDDWWRRCGGVDMKFVNFDYLLKKGHRVIYYPEGIPGIGKGFTRRYQLQHFYSSFIVLASKYNAPVYPVYSVNAEWINPISITFKWLDRLSFKLLGIPFFPIPIVFIALIFPFMFYFAFPANMKFIIGDPVNIRDWLVQTGADPDKPDRESLNEVAARMRKHMQKGLNDAVDKYGRKPYDIKSWYRSMKKMGSDVFRFLPTGWPYTFIRHVRDLERPPARNRFHAWLRDSDLMAYYLPFGWFLLALSRKFRKPPYGYRGLTPAQRSEREGCYLWLLDQRPI